MTERYIHHVTLQSGDVRRSPRSEVFAETIETLIPLLSAALQSPGQRVALPQPIGYTMSASAAGRCLIVTLWTTVLVEGAPQRSPVLTTGVALHSRCGARLWRVLHDGTGPFATHPDEVPPEPWCADRLEVGATLNPEAMQWTGDFSRCVAWTWATMRA